MITKEAFLELVEKNVLDNPQIRGEFFKLKRLYKFNLCLFLIGMVGAVIVSSVVSGPLIFVLFFNVLMVYSFFGLFNVFSRVQVIKKSIFLSPFKYEIYASTIRYLPSPTSNTSLASKISSSSA